MTHGQQQHHHHCEDYADSSQTRPLGAVSLRGGVGVGAKRQKAGPVNEASAGQLAKGAAAVLEGRQCLECQGYVLNSQHS